MPPTQMALIGRPLVVVASACVDACTLLADASIADAIWADAYVADASVTNATLADAFVCNASLVYKATCTHTRSITVVVPARAIHFGL